MNKALKVIFILLGSLCVALAIIGIFFPLLPTTPFLLLAAFFYGRSSQRFLHWLLNNKLFGEYLRNYKEGRGMRLREKILTLLLLWITISFTALYAVPLWWTRLVLFVIAASVTIHILCIKTYRPRSPGGV